MPWPWRRPVAHEGGSEPDSRFSYANERTLLAWIRTSLALIATGFGVTQLLPKLAFAGGRRLIGLPLIILGLVCSLMSMGGFGPPPDRGHPGRRHGISCVGYERRVPAKESSR